MSEFFRALERAERERNLRVKSTDGAGARTYVPPPAPVETAVEMAPAETVAVETPPVMASTMVEEPAVSTARATAIAEEPPVAATAAPVVEEPIVQTPGADVPPADRAWTRPLSSLLAARAGRVSSGEVDDRFNPNGSANNIAGVFNAEGNVLGMMPHPEHAVDPDLGPTGGQQVLQWLLAAARARVPA